ncbi:MAG: hypothetical protein R3B06_08305 [Kofleriaceae bacterium]
MRRLACTVALVVGATAAPAHADRYEATLSGGLHGGLARVAQAGAAAVTVPTFGGSLRLAHAWRNELAWDVQLAGGLTQPATSADVAAVIQGRPAQGDVTRRTATGAIQLGAELRLGSRRIPTLRLALGPQVRHRPSASIGPLDTLPAETTVDALASLGLGLDVRLDAHLLVGVVVEAAHAQPLGGGDPLDVVVLSLRVSYAWYPRIWSPTW